MKRKFINIGDLVRLQQTDIQSDYHGIVTNIRDLANQNGMKERELLVMWCDQYPSTFGKNTSKSSWVSSKKLQVVS